MKRIAVGCLASLGVILTLLFGVYWWFGVSMSTLPNGELIAEVSSPDGEYSIKAYRINGGATTSFWIRGELNFNRTKRRPRNIYWNYREDHAAIEWSDTDTVIINGHQLNVLKDNYDYR